MKKVNKSGTVPTYKLHFEKRNALNTQYAALWRKF